MSITHHGDNGITFPDSTIIQSAISLGRRNLLINPSGQVNQRQASSNADDTYAHDRWNILTQTGTVALSSLADVSDGFPFMMRMTQSQASAQRMGYSQIIEGRDCKHLRGKKVTLSSYMRLSASANVRYAILEWTGTEDAVTSDAVNDWTSSTYTAGNFFNSTTLTVSAVGSQALTATTLTAQTDLSVTLGSSFNNLIVLWWTEGTAAQNVTFDFGRAQLERVSSSATTIVSTLHDVRPWRDEYRDCLRYYQKTTTYSVAPADNVAVGFVSMMSAYDTGNGFSAAVYLPTPLRDIATATLTPYYANGYGASAGKFATYNAGWTALTTNTFSFLNPSHGYFTVARAAAFTANNSYVMAGNFKIENEL